MKNLNQDIKSKEYKSVYLIYGEERYLKTYYKNKLSKDMVAEGDTFNYNYYEGKGISVNEIIDLAETMPFFADNRLIVVENSGFFKKSTPELAEYLSEMPESTRIVFIESEVDKRGKMFTTVKKKGRVVELGFQTDSALIPWITGIVKKDKKSIDKKTILYLLDRVGTDMERLSSEIEKLLCYAYERPEITVEDINEICATQLSEKVFSMIDAVAEKKQQKALDYYYDLMALKEPPIKILSLFITQFRLLYEVKQLTGKRYSDNEIAKLLGRQPFAVKKSRNQSRSFESKQLLTMIEDAVETDEAIKTGRLTDKLGVELYIVKCSMA